MGENFESKPQRVFSVSNHLLRNLRCIFAAYFLCAMLAGPVLCSMFCLCNLQLCSAALHVSPLLPTAAILQQLQHQAPLICTHKSISSCRDLEQLTLHLDFSRALREGFTKKCFVFNNNYRNKNYRQRNIFHK